MKKVMISQPMNGKTNEQIKKERESITKYLETLGYEVVDSIFDFDFSKIEGIKTESLYYLSKSIEMMSKVDAMYFMKRWEHSRGCRVEHNIAIEYNIPILEVE